MKHLLYLLLIFSSTLSVAQSGTEIYLFDIKTKNDKISLHNPRNITNRTGYDNQPFFHPDKPIVYFVSADAEGRTDIFAHNYKKKQTQQITSTPEREYSPTVTPDKKYLSCIIQRDNGAQDLGKYPIEGGEAQVLIDNMIVGYHAWGTHDKVVLFTLPQPFKLQFVNLNTRIDTIIAEKIGRSLHKVPGQNAISFVQNNDGGGNIQKLDLSNLSVSELAKSISTAEHDMAWMPDGRMLMTNVDKIYFFSPTQNADWMEVEFTSIGDKRFSRIAVSADGKRLALVVTE